MFRESPLSFSKSSFETLWKPRSAAALLAVLCRSDAAGMLPPIQAALAELAAAR